MPSRWRRRVAPWAALGLLLAGGSGLAWAQTRPAGTAYRTADVRTGDVGSVLALTGQVHVVDQARAAFPVAATVLSTPVTVGQHVTAGQLLATIDTTALQSSVVDARAALAGAEETLQTAQSAPAPTVATTPAAPAKVTKAPSRPATAAALTQALAAVRRQTAAAQAALAAATAACGGTGGASAPAAGPRRGGRARPSLSPTPSSTPQASPTDSPSASASPATASLPAVPPVVQPAGCLTALQQALGAQQALNRSQTSAGRALATSQPSSAAGSSSTTQRAAATLTARTSSTGSASAGTAATNRSGGPSPAGITSPAARITLDVAAVQAAQVAVTTAERTLAAARLTSPLTGTVATEPFSIGQTETKSQAIVVIGSGQVQVTVNVPSTAVTTVKVGQHAVVSADGSRDAVPGTVTDVALLPTTAANGTVTYPVTILVRQPSTAFHDGGGASVSIVARTVRDAIVVPNSALVNGTVTVVRARRLIPTRVQVGVVGPLTAQVLSGLRTGDLVLLADPGRALPANSTTPTRTFGGSTAPGTGRRGAAGAAALPGG